MRGLRGDVEAVTTQELALSSGPPSAGELETIKEQVRLIAQTEFVPSGLRGKPHAILACVLTGRELGIGPMQALKQIAIVDGKAHLSAELMVALARRRGHSISGKAGPQEAIVTGKRADNGDEVTVTWTLDMAKRAGLLGKKNWSSYPEAMLWARAVSQLCRMLFPDVIAGGIYTADELEDARDHGAIEASLSSLPLPEDEDVRTREEPTAFQRPSDALLNRIAALETRADEHTRRVLLEGAFGVTRADQLSEAQAEQYAAALSLDVEGEQMALEGEVVE